MQNAFASMLVTAVLLASRARTVTSPRTKLMSHMQHQLVRQAEWLGTRGPGCPRSAPARWHGGNECGLECASPWRFEIGDERKSGAAAHALQDASRDS